MYIIHFFDKNYNSVASVRINNNSARIIDSVKKDIEKRFFNNTETKTLVVNSNNSSGALFAYKNSVAKKQKNKVAELFKTEGKKIFNNYNKRYSNIKFYFFDERGIFCKIMKNGKKMRVFNIVEYLNTINF